MGEWERGKRRKEGRRKSSRKTRKEEGGRTGSSRSSLPPLNAQMHTG